MHARQQRLLCYLHWMSAATKRQDVYTIACYGRKHSGINMTHHFTFKLNQYNDLSLLALMQSQASSNKHPRACFTPTKPHRVLGVMVVLEDSCTHAERMLLEEVWAHDVLGTCVASNHVNGNSNDVFKVHLQKRDANRVLKGDWQLHY